VQQVRVAVTIKLGDHFHVLSLEKNRHVSTHCICTDTVYCSVRFILAALRLD